MNLFAYLALSTMLMNPVENPLDSIKAGFIPDKHVQKVALEVASIKGVKVKNITFSNKLNAVEIKINSGILFHLGKNDLNKTSVDALDRISEILIKNPDVGIAVIGHTDNLGSLQLNQRLSENRAHSVTNYLVLKKVSKSQLKEIAGRNYAEPVADNSTPEGRFANRRVDLYLVLKTSLVNVTPESKDTLKFKPVPAALRKIVEEIVKPAKSKEAEIEIDGLLVDDTKTRSGKDFYDYFYNGWEAPGNATNFSLTITEKPFRLTSTLIVVSINENIVYQSILQPRQDIIEGQAMEAVYTTYEYLVNYEEIMKQLNGDDLSGSGIF